MERQLEPEVMDTLQDATDYAAMDHTLPNRSFVDRLKSLMPTIAPGATCHMLDLGTGPGDIPLLLAGEQPDARITAVDLSKNMLDFARRKLAAEKDSGVSIADRVTFQIADVKDLPFQEHTFDAVFSNTILHHIPDPSRMLCEAWRVLKPNGALLIRDLFRPADELTLDQLVTKHAGADTLPQRNMFRDSLHAALTPDELRKIAHDLKMDRCDVVIDSDRHMSLQTSSSA